MRYDPTSLQGAVGHKERWPGSYSGRGAPALLSVDGSAWLTYGRGGVHPAQTESRSRLVGAAGNMLFEGPDRRRVLFPLHGT